MLLLVLWQAPRQRENQLMAIYMGSVVFWGVSVFLAYLSGIIGVDPTYMLYSIASWIGFSGVFLFALVSYYLELWPQKWPQYALAAGLLFYVIAIPLLLQGVLYDNVSLATDGYLIYEIKITGLITFIIAYLFYLGSYLLIYTSKNSRRYDLYWGVTIVTAGVFTSIIPALSKYPLGISSAAISNLFFAYNILNKQLFNPLVAFNEQLQANELRYRTISELTSDYAYALLINPETGEQTIGWLTDAFTRITGYTLAEIEALGSIWAIVHPSDQTAVTAYQTRLMTDDAHTAEFRIMTKDGETRWLRHYGRYQVTADTHYLYGAGEDITPRKQAELELSRAKEAAEEANKAKSSFVSIVSHELKNPITSIIGYTDLLAKNAMGPVSDPQKKFLQIIYNNAERMQLIISDLSDISRIETGQLNLTITTLSLPDTLKDTILPLEQQIKDKQQELNLEIPDDLPLVLADRARLIQILTNLISNAYKYTPNEGQITITADTNYYSMPPSVEIAVRDTGMGIPDDEQTQIFQQFFRSSTTGGISGTGLGLHITRQLVELQDGVIWFESRYGEGTTFTFTLPIKPQ
ncbi:MAG TPA: ATP-binding protein [Anaerolineae bacterium]|nr:ATP-binding protein [Anaerolineae bacterium]